MQARSSMRSDLTNNNVWPILSELLHSIKIRDEDFLTINVF